MQRSAGTLGLLGAGLMAASCAAWPIGGKLDPATSGIVGEWTRRNDSRPDDSLFWRFRADGVAETFKLRVPEASSSRWTRIAVMRWEVRRNRLGDPRPAVCLDSGGRTPWPSCQLFTIDAVTDTAGQTRRRLTWEGWLGDRRMTTQVFWERRP